MDDKLTIVGPEPSDDKDTRSGRKVNIEALLLMAKYDKRFRELLLKNRDEAIEKSGLNFSKGEKLLLTTISDKQLEQSINEFRIPGITKKSVPDWMKATAVLLLISTISIASSSCLSKGIKKNDHVTKGVEPDEIEKVEKKEIPPTRGIDPD